MNAMTDTDVDEGATDHSSATVPVWRKVLVRCGLVYLFSRLCVVLGAAVVAAELTADENLRAAELPWARWADPHYVERPVAYTAVRPVLDVLTSWDGIWYLRLVRMGYPRQVTDDVTYFVDDARAAFFPLYPGLVRIVDRVLPGGDTFAALFTNFVLGAVAVLLVGMLAREIFDVRVAERTMILMAVFPGSFVLSFAYTEALLIVLAAGCLLLLQRRQWWWAGVLAALGGATRPNGIALAIACAVAALLAVRERREWTALGAALLAPIGFIGFQLWLGWHADEPGVWFRVQREAWAEGTSWGWTAVRRTVDAFIDPGGSPTDLITAVSVFTLGFLVWTLARHRLPIPQVAYAATVIALMLIPSTVTARPRFIYTAFPLLIAAAAWFERRGRNWWPHAYAACTAGLVGLTALYGVLGAIP